MLFYFNFLLLVCIRTKKGRGGFGGRKLFMPFFIIVPYVLQNILLENKVEKKDKEEIRTRRNEQVLTDNSREIAFSYGHRGNLISVYLFEKYV